MGYWHRTTLSPGTGKGGSAIGIVLPEPFRRRFRRCFAGGARMLASEKTLVRGRSRLSQAVRLVNGWYRNLYPLNAYLPVAIIPATRRSPEFQMGRWTREGALRGEPGDAANSGARVTAPLLFRLNRLDLTPENKSDDGYDSARLRRMYSSPSGAFIFCREQV